MYPDAVERLVGAAEGLGSSSATKVIPFFDCHFTGADGRPSGGARPYRMDNSMSPIEQGASMFNEYFGNFAFSIIHRSILGEAGGFDEGFVRCEDIELSMRLVPIHGYRYHHVPRIIYGYRTHDEPVVASVLETEEAKYMIHRKMIAALGDTDRKKYEEAVRETAQRMSVTAVCRDTVRLVSPLVYGPHDGAAARLASWTLRALLTNPLAQRLTNAIRFRVRAGRDRARQSA